MMGNNQNSNAKVNNFVMSNQLIGNYETRVDQVAVQLSSWETFVNGINSLLDYFMPLQGDIVFVASHYDKNIEGYFEFLRFLFIFSIYIFFTYLYLIISHTINFDFDQVYGNWCTYYLPCIVCFVIFFGTIKKYMQFNKKDVFQKLYEGEQLNYSKMFLNICDWNVRDQALLEDTRYRVKNIITIGIKEEEIKYLFYLFKEKS